ncbi:MAG: DnaJ domain-containing protein [Rubrimonas sp.]|uniref:DnaJ domain-containing protein n=1 Tax=Rubrimonas sp. TaxID=2036015 RepID=UPI002FDEAD4E
MASFAFALLLGIVLAATLRAALRGGIRAQRVIGGGALAAAALLLLARQLGLAAALAMAGAALLARERAVRAGDGDGWARSGGASEVRSRMLAMRLDHATGEMEGEVLGGPFAGRKLSSLSLAEALTLAAAIEQDDAQSLTLLCAWLDRAHPDWREADAGPEASRADPPSPDLQMTRARAYEILGLAPGADAAAIRAAHRRLMKKVHPDQGGSAALAAEINAAKTALLG